jgi:hypothetical protein
MKIPVESCDFNARKINILPNGRRLQYALRTGDEFSEVRNYWRLEKINLLSVLQIDFLKVYFIADVMIKYDISLIILVVAATAL